MYLKDDVFSHGQIYVAFSRHGDPDKLWVFANISFRNLRFTNLCQGQLMMKFLQEIIFRPLQELS